MQRQETVTRTVQILDILPDEPQRILTAERLMRNGKPGRLFQQMLPVPDADLFSRLLAQVGKGDMVTVTVTTVWTADNCHSVLTDFALPAGMVIEARQALSA